SSEFTWQPGVRVRLAHTCFTPDHRSQASAEFRQHITHGLTADDAGLVPVLAAGGDMQHVPWSGVHRMVVEPVAEVSGQDEDGMAGFAPVAFRPARCPLLVAERD